MARTGDALATATIETSCLSRRQACIAIALHGRAQTPIHRVHIVPRSIASQRLSILMSRPDECEFTRGFNLYAVQ